MLTTGERLISCSRRVCGAASASPARWMIASTAPVESSTPNSSRASSVVSRRETRLRTASVTTAACQKEPVRVEHRPSVPRLAATENLTQRQRPRRCIVRAALARYRVDLIGRNHVLHAGFSVFKMDTTGTTPIDEKPRTTYARSRNVTLSPR
jgi:hypothetical protein